MEPNIAVLGDGAWGCAIANLIATNGYPVKLWCYNQSIANQIQTSRKNSLYLPSIELSTLITPTADLEKALHQTSFIFEAIPVKFLRSVIRQCQPLITYETSWIVLSKGIENNTLDFSSQIIQQELGLKATIGVLSGPSFAKEVALKQPTAVMFAGSNALAQQIVKFIANDYFKVFLTSDKIGVELCGAYKNCIALALGIIDGLGYYENTKAFFITQGLQEMTLLIDTMQGSRETVYSLAGIGDLILTASSNKSKNFSLGQSIGQRQPLESILSNLTQQPEGINSVLSFYTLNSKLKLNLPMLSSLYEILYNNADPDLLIAILSNKKRA